MDRDKFEEIIATPLEASLQELHQLKMEFQKYVDNPLTEEQKIECLQMVRDIEDTVRSLRGQIIQP